MSQPYVGEIRLLPYGRGAPSGWLPCNGSLESISEYEVLFTLIGTTYGGDGQTTFQLPDMRGRIPIHQGTGAGLSPYSLGQVSGSEGVTLTVAQMGSHFHLATASLAPATSNTPTGNIPAAGIIGEPFYDSQPSSGTTSNLAPNAVSMTGVGLPHDNMGPTLGLQYCIATVGIFPTQS
ncbi:MAG: tail fiber protein [Pseudomonadota bacterium]